MVYINTNTYRSHIHIFMIKLNEIKTKDLSNLTQSDFVLYFNNIPASEIAFLSFINKTFPKKYVDTKWVYNKNIQSGMQYSKLEKLQYYLFLYTNNIFIISSSVISSLLLFVIFFTKKNVNKKQSTSYKNVKSLSIDDIDIKMYTKGGKKYINKTDKLKIYNMIDLLMDSSVLNWGDMMDIEDILKK